MIKIRVAVVFAVRMAYKGIGSNAFMHRVHMLATSPAWSLLT